MALVAFGCFTVWWRHLRPPLTGDEPHYLVIAHSIAAGHDLDLRDDYPVVAPLAPGLTPLHHAVVMRDDGRLRPIQGVGLGVILAPAWWLSSGPASALTWARLIMILVAALVVGETHWLARDLARRRPLAAVAASGAMIAALPFVGYSNQVYPEIPAASLALAALIAFRRRGTVAGGIVIGTAAGLLLWLSPRYAPLAAGLLGWQLYRLTRIGGPAPTRRLAVVLATSVPIALLGILLASWYQHAFGTLSLQAIYRAADIPIGHSAIVVYQRSAGELLDPVGGLLPYAPVLLLGVAGLGALARARRAATAMLGVVGIVYLVGFATAGFRGYALPGRMTIVAIPMLALGLAALLDHTNRTVTLAATTTVAVLALVSVAITMQSARRDTYGRLYLTNVVPAAPIVAQVASLWPRFVPAPATTAAGARRSSADRNRPVRGDVPVTVAWFAILAAGASLVFVARDTSGP